MKKRSHKKKNYCFAEKIAYYNRRLKEQDFNDKPFGNGYLHGAEMYAEYNGMSDSARQDVKAIFNDFSKRAKNGDAFSKGVMCAARDAANARKNKTF